MTLPAPITQPEPILTPGRMVQFAPIQTPYSTPNAFLITLPPQQLCAKILLRQQGGGEIQRRGNSGSG